MLLTRQTRNLKTNAILFPHAPSEVFLMSLLIDIVVVDILKGKLLKISSKLSLYNKRVSFAKDQQVKNCKQVNN